MLEKAKGDLTWNSLSIPSPVSIAIRIFEKMITIDKAIDKVLFFLFIFTSQFYFILPFIELIAYIVADHIPISSSSCFLTL